MRYKIANFLEKEMEENPNIFFITGDLGYKIFDNLMLKFPDRAFSMGASEQLMLGTAVGLATMGKIPFVYSITPFLLYRPFEIIRNYLNHENLNVNMIGCGRDSDYAHDGFSHFAGDDVDILKSFENIVRLKPNTIHELNASLRYAVDSSLPTYINITR